MLASAVADYRSMPATDSDFRALRSSASCGLAGRTRCRGGLPVVAARARCDRGIRRSAAGSRSDARPHRGLRASHGYLGWQAVIRQARQRLAPVRPVCGGRRLLINTVVPVGRPQGRHQACSRRPRPCRRAAGRACHAPTPPRPTHPPPLSCCRDPPCQRIGKTPATAGGKRAVAQAGDAAVDLWGGPGWAAGGAA